MSATVNTATATTDTDFYMILDGGISQDNLNENCCICLDRLFTPNDSDGSSSGPGLAQTDNQFATLSTADDSKKAKTSGPETPADDQIVKLKKCGHMFHRNCIEQMQLTQRMPKVKVQEGYLQCPICKTIHGIKIGTQPEGGTMKHRVIKGSLSGYEGHKTIEIEYNFKFTGIQGPEHPHPGKKYYAHPFPRFAYIPDTEKGRRVLKLLERAFKQRLTFTVGRSVTTGNDDMVTWNDIHHKTVTEPYSTYGYPDPNYLDNVIEELKQHGICDDESDEDEICGDDSDEHDIVRVETV